MYEEPKSWEVLDQARLDRTMDLLREARDQPKCTDYSAAVLRKRLSLLPEGSYIKQLDSVSALAAVSTFSSLRLLQLTQAIAAVACSASESGDRQRFQEFSSDGDRLIRSLCVDEVGTLVEEMGKGLMVSTLTESFHSAAATLRHEGETTRWKAIEDRLKDNNAKRPSRDFIVDGKAIEAGTITGGIMAGGIELVAKQPETQPPLTDSDQNHALGRT